MDIIEDIDEYQTWPGWLILVLRCLIIVWFLLELRTTMRYEHNESKLNFFLHFGASALVWYIYLPIVALLALLIPPFWRYKLLLGNRSNLLAFLSNNIVCKECVFVISDYVIKYFKCHQNII